MQQLICQYRHNNLLVGIELQSYNIQLEKEIQLNSNHIY